MDAKKRNHSPSPQAARRKPRKLSRRQRRAQARLKVVIALTLVAVTATGIMLITAPRRSHKVIDNFALARQREAVEAPTITLGTGEEVGRQVEILAPASAETTPDAAELPEVEETPGAIETPPIGETLTAAQPEGGESGLSTLEGPAPTPEVTPTTASDMMAEMVGGLPVYKSADTVERKIAITVDDCNQVQNLQTIVKTAYANKGKLTIFPIGMNLSKPDMENTLKTCVFKLGYEIENHTWSHQRIFRLPEMQMAEEIWKQSAALNQLLGVNYRQHFFRLMGGDGTSDARTHSYLSQLGYKGIAEWSVSGSDSTMDMIKAGLQPGAIYLFHTTDADTAKLQEFIPYAVAQGYQLVTLNELLGYRDNEIGKLTSQSMPIPVSTANDFRTHKHGDYAWRVTEIQDALRKMGLLQMDGPSTGYYGDRTVEAVRAYQAQVGLPATGVADSETQKMLLQS